MKRKINYLGYPFVIILMSFLIITSCNEDDPEPVARFFLTLEANPEYAGAVDGAGEYIEGEEVEISSTSNHNWRFKNWAGATQYVDDPEFGNTTIKMPAYDISLTAHFEEKSIVYGDGVTDIDGNEYVTVIIGNQEWIAENLRVSKYNNSDDIPTGLSNDDWHETTDGAFAIYPHDSINGLNSDAEVVAAYGKLYNWFAVDDDRGLCPEGWSVPADDDWEDLIYYIGDQGFANTDSSDGAANALKSCHQLGSPLGDDCNTSEHPRWASDDIHYGIDEFGFSALPGGYLVSTSMSVSFSTIGGQGHWWSSNEASSTSAWSRVMHAFHGNIYHMYFGGNKKFGHSVRCFREVVPSEDE